MALGVAEPTARALLGRHGTDRVVDALDGAAEAAGVNPLDMFAESVEEIWYPQRTPAHARGCSDLAAGRPASANGHVLVGHNNDLSRDTEERIVAVERDIPGEPLTLTIGVGPWPSVGWNDSGISFTGNELSPNDEQVGIPRLLQFRAMLSARTPEEATALALHSGRASSYNNLVANDGGTIVNIEGSATDAELTAPSERGTLAHTNHYACDRMLAFEGDPDYATRSEVRLNRARQLLDDAGAGSIDESSLRTMLSDHENAPDSICRHEGDSQTVFWCVADVTDMRITYGRGNPCGSEASIYSFS
ncbi:MAG: C45 family peptidase [Actinomycetota bacterium]